MEATLAAPPPRRRNSWIARVVGFSGGALLALCSLIAYVVAGFADDAVDAGNSLAEDALRSGEVGIDGEAADQAADWWERIANTLVGGRPDQFRTLALIALAAGVVAMLVALLRQPDRLWPEIAWGATSLAGLAPN